MSGCVGLQYYRNLALGVVFYSIGNNDNEAHTVALQPSALVKYECFMHLV